MASYNYTKFEGIKAYHEGMPVSVYRNMIPMGDCAVDRLGEQTLLSQTNLGKYRGSFGDSLGNTYIVLGSAIYMYSYDFTTHALKPFASGELRKQLYARNGQPFIMLDNNSLVSFCESATKPSQVYVCDGTYIYWWNTESDSAASWTEAFIVNMMILPGMTTTYIGQNNDTSLNAIIQNNADLYDQLTSKHDFNWVTTDAVPITYISWFNNRLVATQQSRNSVWLTATDPGQFFRWSNQNDNGNPIPNQFMFTYNDSDTTTDTNTTTAQNALWTYWVSSTNGADRLNQAIAFNGTLYFLNASTIECWSATGIESAPIQHSSLNTIQTGGMRAVILDNIMAFIGVDQMGSKFIGAISDGKLVKLSTPEINHRITFGSDVRLYVIRQRDDSFIAINTYTTAGASKDWYIVSLDGYWWKWENAITADEWAVISVIDDLAISNKGSLLLFTDDTRTLCDGHTPILRAIRSWFHMFHNRQILRHVAVALDTGHKLSGTNGDLIYCRVSFDRAHSFEKFNYRKLAENNHNDKTIEWRNLGSGNNATIEIGTGADYKMQVYMVQVEFD